MSVTLKELIPSKFAENTATVQYTVPTNAKAIIDKFTVTNTTANLVDFSVNLIQSGALDSDDTRILTSRTLAENETYTCPELVGHILDGGSAISTLATAATSLTIRCSGRVVTP